MERFKKNHISKYGIRAMFEVMLFLPIYLYNKIKYQDNYSRFKEVKGVMLNVARVQKQYIKKTLNYVTGNTEIDYSTVPNVYFCWDKNKITLKVRFRYRIKQSDIDTFLEELKFATQLIPIDYHAKDLYFYLSLVSDAGKPLAKFIDDKNLIPFGTKYGLPVKWDYNKFPHAIISGETGEGKTSLVYYLFSSILSNFKSYCIDGKDVDYWSLRDEFSEYAGISNYNECFNLMKRFQSGMQVRYDEMKKRECVKYTELDMDPIFMLIDEFPSVVEALDTAKVKGEKYTQRDEFLRIVGDVVRRGRAAGYFMVICMQRADARYIGGDTRDNMRLKIALGSATEDSYAMLFGNDNRDLEELLQGQGYYKQGNELSMFSYYYMSKVELDKQLPG